MKPKTILIIWAIATFVGLVGVHLFVSTSVSTTISRTLMGISILLQLTWMAGLIALIFKRVRIR